MAESVRRQSLTGSRGPTAARSALGTQSLQYVGSRGVASAAYRQGEYERDRSVGGTAGGRRNSQVPEDRRSSLPRQHGTEYTREDSDRRERDWDYGADAAPDRDGFRDERWDGDRSDGGYSGYSGRRSVGGTRTPLSRRERERYVEDFDVGAPDYRGPYLEEKPGSGRPGILDARGGSDRRTGDDGYSMRKRGDDAEQLRAEVSVLSQAVESLNRQLADAKDAAARAEDRRSAAEQDSERAEQTAAELRALRRQMDQLQRARCVLCHVVPETIVQVIVSIVEQGRRGADNINAGHNGAEQLAARARRPLEGGGTTACCDTA